jgi:hypothetical protein
VGAGITRGAGRRLERHAGEFWCWGENKGEYRSRYRALGSKEARCGTQDTWKEMWISGTYRVKRDSQEWYNSGSPVFRYLAINGRQPVDVGPITVRCAVRTSHVAGQQTCVHTVAAPSVFDFSFQFGDVVRKASPREEECGVRQICAFVRRSSTLRLVSTSFMWCARQYETCSMGLLSIGVNYWYYHTLRRLLI